MKLTFQTFEGIIPRRAGELLPGNKGQLASNCKLTNGLLRPYFNASEDSTLANTSLIPTIYRHLSTYWFEWLADVNVVKGPVSADTTGKVYYTGDGIPKKTNTSLATTGAGPMPIDFYPLAVAHGNIALTSVAGAGGTGDPRNINYVWTCVTSWGEEGLPSPASTTLSAMNGQTIALTGVSLIWRTGATVAVGDFCFPTTDEGGDYMYKCVTAGVSGGTEPTWGTTVDADTDDGTAAWRCFTNNISSKRIYRMNTGETNASYQYLTAIDIGDTTYSDSTEDADLGEVLPSEDWDQPPDGLTGLCYLGNGIMLGYSGKDLYASEPYRPWAWPTDYSNALTDTIKAVVTLGGSAVVVTESNPYLVTGRDPGSLSVVPLSDPHAGVAKRGSVGCTLGAIYPSADGLMLITPDGQATLLTGDLYTVEQWQELHPTTLHAYIHDNKYFGFYSYGGREGAIVLDLKTMDLTHLDLYTSAAFVESATDTLYYVVEEDGAYSVYEWEGDVLQPFTMLYVWGSKKILLPKRTSFSCARVIAETQDRQTYYDALVAYKDAVRRNAERISAYLTGGAVGEDPIGDGIPIDGDLLEDVTDPGDYSGDFELSMDLYIDGEFQFTKEVYANGIPFRLAQGCRGRTFEIELVGNVEVKRVDIASDMAELKQDEAQQ